MAYPHLVTQLRVKSLNRAIIDTFMKVLAERPDTFISRRIGAAPALAVSAYARQALLLGGADTPEGKESILLFDKRLRDSGNDYNPGTTADIIAAALAVCTLGGYRP